MRAVGGWGAAGGGSRAVAAVLGDVGRARALACAAGHRESREARKGPQGGGVERRAYSLRSNIVSETEETLRGVSRRAVVDGGASDAPHGKSRAA